MTREEINIMKYKVCCPMCDNKKCVKGTYSCEAEQWAKSKAEVIKLIDKHTNDDGTLDNDITCILEELPPIQPKAKVGRWISIYGNVKCSVCGNTKDGRSVGKATHYCDFCGAKMEVEE